MKTHKITRHRHNQDACTSAMTRNGLSPSSPNWRPCTTKIEVHCSCGWAQGCTTRAQAKMIGDNHLRCPDAPVVSATEVQEQLNLRTMKLEGARPAEEILDPDITNALEAEFS